MPPSRSQGTSSRSHAARGCTRLVADRHKLSAVCKVSHPELPVAVAASGEEPAARSAHETVRQAARDRRHALAAEALHGSHAQCFALGDPELPVVVAAARPRPAVVVHGKPVLHASVDLPEGTSIFRRSSRPPLFRRHREKPSLVLARPLGQTAVYVEATGEEGSVVVQHDRVEASRAYRHDIRPEAHFAQGRLFFYKGCVLFV